MRTWMICLTVIYVSAIAATALVAKSGGDAVRAIPLSPCQCIIQGGCLMQGKPRA